MLVKICGLTRPEEAAYLNKNGADYAGFVLFFPKSKRCISISDALPIMAELDPRIKKVAVTVEPDAGQLAEIVAAGFDLVQIHGSIDASLIEDLDIPVLKAFNVSDLDSYEYYHSHPGIAGYVFDAQIPGSGKTFEWSLISEIPHDEKLMFLAGGLSPENVAMAVRALHPDGVDVSSGVEYPGQEFRGKDPDLVAELIKEAKKA